METRNIAANTMVSLFMADSLSKAATVSTVSFTVRNSQVRNSQVRNSQVRNSQVRISQVQELRISIFPAAQGPQSTRV
jgi:hypothetical protein